MKVNTVVHMISWRRRQYDSVPAFRAQLARLRVQKVQNLGRALGVDPRTVAESGVGSPFGLLRGPERGQQGALAGRADAGDFLQAGLAYVLFAELAVRADHKAMRLVAQPLDEIQNRVAR